MKRKNRNSHHLRGIAAAQVFHYFVKEYQSQAAEENHSDLNKPPCQKFIETEKFSHGNNDGGDCMVNRGMKHLIFTAWRQGPMLDEMVDIIHMRHNIVLAQLKTGRI